MKVSIVRTENAIAELITKIGKTGKELDKDIHTALCSIASMVHEHNGGGASITLANKLLKNLAKGTRNNAVIAWLEKFGGCKYLAIAKDAEGKVLPAKLIRSKKPVNLTDGMEQPFWTLLAHEGGDYKPFDFNKALEQLIKRAKKAREDNINEGKANAVSQAQIDMLESLKGSAVKRANDGVAK